MQKNGIKQITSKSQHKYPAKKKLSTAGPNFGHSGTGSTGLSWCVGGLLGSLTRRVESCWGSTGAIKQQYVLRCHSNLAATKHCGWKGAPAVGAVHPSDSLHTDTHIHTGISKQLSLRKDQICRHTATTGIWCQSSRHHHADLEGHSSVTVSRHCSPSLSSFRSSSLIVAPSLSDYSSLL